MRRKRISQWLTPYNNRITPQNGILIIVSIIIGLYLGNFYGEWVDIFVPYGQILSKLLSVWILPILLSGITLTMIKLISQHREQEKNYLTKIIITGLFFISIVSTITLLIAKIVLRSNEALRNNSELLSTLGKLLIEEQVNSSLKIPLIGLVDHYEAPRLLDLIINIIPNNIFYALAQHQTASIVFFAVVFGFFYGDFYGESKKKNHNYSDRFVKGLEVIHESLSKSMGWFKLLLPFLLIIKAADITHKLGGKVFISMSNFVISFMIIFAVIFLISFLIILIRSQLSILVVISSLINPIVFTLFTRDSLNSIPFTTSALHTNLKFDETTVKLVTPFLMTITRFGSVAYLIFSALFVTELYSQKPDLSEIVILIAMSTILGISTSGEEGIIGLLIPILSLLSVPPEAALVLLSAVDPIIEPFREVSTVLPTIAATTIIASRKP